MFLKTYRGIRNNCMRTRKKFPFRLAAGLLLAILIDTAVQLVWKSAIVSLPNNGSPWLNVQALLHSPLALSVLCLMVCQFFNWLTVLSNADLSYAQPVTSLSYVSVFCLSVLYFKEATDLIQIIGILFVFSGVWFISQTDHVTSSKEREA
jgi:drug/metabolite transporter (DMT)-like permease